ncbi:MAG: PilZ domain-containing protein [Gammaproteobacteria bacterium]|nr:PilZ domain-containing protein [Gammaproteobacteria bacterium]
MLKTNKARQNILSLSIKDKSALYSAYMSYVEGGGLFIPTNKNYKLGDEVFMLLTLLDEKDKIPVAGKIVWITPPGCQGNKTVGVGVQFGDQDNGQAKNKIETHIAGMPTDKTTHTM